jgi:peptidoglycan/xylan/chitin deacetylase (PgdA/CDA1 family)
VNGQPSLSLRVTAKLPVKITRNKSHRPLASVSFDDFPKSAWEVGGRILDQYDAKATYYAVGDFCGRTVDGVRQYDPEDIRGLVACGHELGSHTYRHTSVITATNQALIQEEEDNKAFFNSILGDYHLSTFAYPFGDISPRTKRLYSKLFPLSRGIRRGLNGKWFDLAQVKAIPLEAREWDPAVIEDWVLKAKATNAWLCLFTHDVSDNPTPWGATPEMLKHALSTIRRCGIEIHTVKAAMALTQFEE